MTLIIVENSEERLAISRETYDRCEMIHAGVTAAEREIGYWLDKLMKQPSGGWSSETLPMIWLHNDVQNLRALADSIEKIREAMIA